MNIIPLEPERVNNLNLWWLKPEAGQLIECLEKAHLKAIFEHSELFVKATGENNEQFRLAADAKLFEAVELEKTIKVLRSFFPDGPFIARIEL